MSDDAKRLPDCRTCARHTGWHWPGRCSALVRCVDGDAYQPTQPVFLWVASKKVVTVPEKA